MKESELNMFDFIINDENEVMLLIYARDSEPGNSSLLLESNKRTAVLERNIDSRILLGDIPQDIFDVIKNSSSILVCELSIEEKEEDTEIIFSYEANVIKQNKETSSNPKLNNKFQKIKDLRDKINTAPDYFYSIYPELIPYLNDKYKSLESYLFVENNEGELCVIISIVSSSPQKPCIYYSMGSHAVFQHSANNCFIMDYIAAEVHEKLGKSKVINVVEVEDEDVKDVYQSDIVIVNK